MKKVRKNGLSGATAIVTPLIFLMSLATRRFFFRDFFAFCLFATFLQPIQLQLTIQQFAILGLQFSEETDHERR